MGHSYSFNRLHGASWCILCSTIESPVPPHLRFLPLLLPLLHLHCHPLHHPEGQPRRKLDSACSHIQSPNCMAITRFFANKKQKLSGLNHEKQQKKRGKSWISSLEGLSTPYNNFQSTAKIGISTHQSSIAGQEYDFSCRSNPVDLRCYWEGGYPKLITITNRDTQTVVEFINFG